MRTLIIARHGNTFRKGETPTRVGSRTDLELVEEERGLGIGRYLLKLGLQPTRILAAPLKRTMGTARLAAQALASTCDVQPDARFIEVDYGPDENKTEEEVMARLGAVAYRQAGSDPDSLIASPPTAPSASLPASPVITQASALRTISKSLPAASASSPPRMAKPGSAESGVSKHSNKPEAGHAHVTSHPPTCLPRP